MTHVRFSGTHFFYMPALSKPQQERLGHIIEANPTVTARQVGKINVVDTGDTFYTEHDHFLRELANEDVAPRDILKNTLTPGGASKLDFRKSALTPAQIRRYFQALWRPLQEAIANLQANQGLFAQATPGRHQMILGMPLSEELQNTFAHRLEAEGRDPLGGFKASDKGNVT